MKYPEDYKDVVMKMIREQCNIIDFDVDPRKVELGIKELNRLTNDLMIWLRDNDK